MCKARDVALAVLQKSIKLAADRNDERYYMDYVKLHKLLYLGQCMVLSQYGITLFNEPIYAHNCGPYIQDELDFITAEYGFGKIKDLKNAAGEYPIILPLPALRDEVVDHLLEQFGTVSTEDIVATAKQTDAYAKHQGCYDDRPIISRSDMVQAGNALLGVSG